MRRNKERLKPSKSLRQKLLLYFSAFSAVILCILWLTQTVFLDDLYRMIKTSRIESSADYIVDRLGEDDVAQLLDELHEQNDMSIEVYDTSSDVAFYLLYTSREQGDLGMEYMPHQLYTYYNDAKAQNGELTAIEEINTASKNQGDDNKKPHQNELEGVSALTCIRVVGQSDSELMVVIRSSITPINSTVTTMRFLLFIITGLVVILSGVFAVLVSWHFSHPLKDTTQKAKRLALEDYSANFNSSGYKEVEELNSTLNFAAKELSVATELRKELIANVSHDLRTPLTMIKGYAEVMQDIPGEMNEKNLQAIVDESTRLSQLVSDLLDISKLQSGAVPIEKRRFSLTKCVSDILTRFSGISEQQGYSLSFDFGEDIEVYADKKRIEQVLYNLISNAVNYSGDKKEVKVTQLVSDKVVRIEITDSGDGIEPEKLKNIWDRYYRAEKNHQRAVVGTGLGLSIVKEILDLHRAHFGVRSTVGEGSTFWFELERLDKQDLQ